MVNLLARGFGFVEIEGRDEDIFIPASYVSSAMNGDIVAAKINEEKSEKYTGKREEGIIVQILKRNIKMVVISQDKSR